MNIIDEMKERVTMKELLESYGIQPVRGNNIYRCFAHDDNKPSANIIKGANIFHCFACQYNADIIDAVQKLENCNLKTALNIIDNKFGLGLMHELTRAEKLELTRMQKERERLKREKEEKERFENQTIIAIANKMRSLEQVQKICQELKGKAPFITRYEVYIDCEKQLKWINWLYDAICGFDHPECEFDYVYGTCKQELLEKIKKGEIEIW